MLKPMSPMRPMAHWGLLWPRARRAALATAARPDADPLGRWLACGLATVAVAHRAKGGSKAEIREVREIRAPETHRRNYEFVRLENGMQVGSWKLYLSGRCVRVMKLIVADSTKWLK